jgi:hypothetical protein
VKPDANRSRGVAVTAKVFNDAPLGSPS